MPSGQGLDQSQLMYAIIAFNVTVIVVFLITHNLSANAWTWGSAFLTAFIAILIAAAAAAGAYFVSGKLNE
jgi:hypothetical protein